MSMWYMIAPAAPKDNAPARGIPLPVTPEQHAAYGELYRRWVRAMRSGQRELATKLADEYRAISAPKETTK